MERKRAAKKEESEREKERDAPSPVSGHEISSFAPIGPPQCSEREEAPLLIITPTVEI